MLKNFEKLSLILATGIFGESRDFPVNPGPDPDPENRPGPGFRESICQIKILGIRRFSWFFVLCCGYKKITIFKR